MPVDSSVMGCQVCETKFTLITRRHWCRACLKTICSKCSSAFSQSTSLLSKLSRRHENNLCTLCQEATRFAIEERMLADAFKRHTERVPSNSASSQARGSRQLFQDGESSADGPRRVASATPRQRSMSASLVRPKEQRRVSISPMVMKYGFEEEESSNGNSSKGMAATPPPTGFSAARRRTSCSAYTPKRRMSVSFAVEPSFVEPASPFRGDAASPASTTAEKDTLEQADPACVAVVKDGEKEAIAPLTAAATEVVVVNLVNDESGSIVEAAGIEDVKEEGQENCSPKKVVRRSSTGLPKITAAVKPILKARSSTQQRAVVRNM